jgi:hypothetical protein
VATKLVMATGNRVGGGDVKGKKASARGDEGQASARGDEEQGSASARGDAEASEKAARRQGAT